jgi:tetratricopeptide (TPR) repeat protein
MVRLHQDSIGEYGGLLAWHFIKGEDYERGAGYSELASKKANKAASSKEVFQHAQNRISCLEKLPSSESNVKRVIDARAALAMYYINYSHIGRAYEAVSPIADLARNMDYQKALPMIHAAMGTFQVWYEEDYQQGLQYLNEVLKINARTARGISYWFTLWNLGWFYSWDCQFDKGRKYFERALEMSKAANNPLGISSTKSTVTGINYIVRGEIDLALETSRESLRIADEIGDIYGQGLAYASYGLSCYLKGDFDQAERFLLKGSPILEGISQVIWSAWNAGWLSWLYTERADYEKARDYSIRVRSILLDNGGFSPSLINMLTLSCARSEALNQKRDINLSEMIKCYETNRLRILEGLMARYIGEICLCMGEQNTSEAEKWVRKAIEADGRNGTIWFLAGDYACLSDLCRRRGDLLNAREHMGKALEVFRNCGADGWAEKYGKELAALS